MNKYIGKKYANGNLLVKEQRNEKINGKWRIYFYCECFCGNKKWMRADNVTSGRVNSCGCLGKTPYIGKKVSDKSRLTVIKDIGVYKYPSGKGSCRIYKCLCDCGKEVEVLGNNLTQTNSCGCINDENRAKMIPEERFGIIEHTSITMLSSNKIATNNTSGIKGVSYHKQKNKWTSRLSFKGKSYWLGAYNTIEEATTARKIAEEKLYGDFLKWYAKEYPERWEKMNKTK